MEVEKRLQSAVQRYWDGRTKNKQKQIDGGRIDAGNRGEVTGGSQMGALELLVSDVLIDAGLKRSDIRTRTALELPGFFRATKKWDLVVISDQRLLLAMEFKSQAGRSIGNNFNNRSEEAVGSAKDIWVAFREGRFGTAPRPFLGYFFLLEEHGGINRPVANKEPCFPVDPVFRGRQIETRIDAKFAGVSYCERYELLCRRLVMENLYTSSCFLTATNEKRTKITQPAADLSFQRFVAALRGHVLTFLESR